MGKAGHACGKVINTQRRRGAESARAKAAQGIIRRIVDLINSIGYLSSRADQSDKDMHSEEQHAERARAERQARDEAKAAAALAQQGSA